MLCKIERGRYVAVGLGIGRLPASTLSLHPFGVPFKMLTLVALPDPEGMGDAARGSMLECVRQGMQYRLLALGVQPGTVPPMGSESRGEQMPGNYTQPEICTYPGRRVPHKVG